MNNVYWVIVAVMVVLLAGFVYYDTRNGFHRSLYRLLRLLLPLVLAGVIVFLVSFITQDNMIRHILALVLSFVFFIVLSASLRLPEKRTQNDVVSVFLGALIGVARVWLVIGFLALFLAHFGIVRLDNILGGSFYNALVTPVNWLLFFTFLS